MTIPEILNDEALRQREFPIATRQAFLAHAGVCPLPARVAAAVSQYAGEACLDEQEIPVSVGRIQHTRALAARLLGARAEEISLVGPTSLGLSLVASGLPWRKGDNVLIYQDDFPSNVYPWMALAERGVEVRLMNVRGLGRIRPRDVVGQVDEQTRLVALASCHYISGWRLEIQEIGALLRRRNILFCLDGIQTLGAFPTAVEGVDFLAADAHKWLLGPSGAGLLYVSRDLQDRLRPPVYGWHNIRSANLVAQERMVYPPDGRRYEAGTANLLGLVGLEAALELILEVGVDLIAAELRRKRQWLLAALSSRGYTVLHADAPPENAGGITTFSRPGADLAALQSKLAAAGVQVSLRCDRAGQPWLRLSPHFYNTDAELERCMAEL